MIAVCGTGMGALALLFRERGIQVSGSDVQAYPPMGDLLRRAGVSLSLGYGPENVPEDVDSVLEARFLAGKSGWQNGGKVVLRDDEGLPWTIVIHRFAKPVELFKGEVDIYLPQDKQDVRF